MHAKIAREVLANRVPTTVQFISGEWEQPASGRTLDVHDPSTGELVHQGRRRKQL